MGKQKFKECENCGFDERKPTRLCPGCGKALCEGCDMGARTVCAECEASK